MEIKQLKARILENKKIAQDFCKMRIASTYLAKNIKPGQFIEVRCSDAVDPLLRRPFSVHRILKDSIEILYEVVGKGTELLSRKKQGECVDVIGPLGNGFKIESTEDRVQRTEILVAGGIGVAPLLALTEELAYPPSLKLRRTGSVERIAYRKKRNIYVIIGAKTKSYVLCEQDFKKVGCEVLITTEDGSQGKRGLATAALKELLNAIRYPLNATLYACGPNAMLKEVARIAKTKDIPCQVSLEERMACGVGVCLGCPVKMRTAYSVQRLAPSGFVTQYAIRNTQYEYKMVCKDGPVFNAADIIW